MVAWQQNEHTLKKNFLRSAVTNLKPEHQRPQQQELQLRPWQQTMLSSAATDNGSFIFAASLRPLNYGTKPFGLEVPQRNESAIKPWQDNTSLVHRAWFLHIHAVLMWEMIQDVCDQHPLQHISHHSS